MNYNRIVLVGRIVRPRVLQVRQETLVHLLPAIKSALHEIDALADDCIALVEGALSIREGLAFVLVDVAIQLRRPRWKVTHLARGLLTEKRPVAGHKRVLRSGKIIDVAPHERRMAKRKDKNGHGDLPAG